MGDDQMLRGSERSSNHRNNEANSRVALIANPVKRQFLCSAKWWLYSPMILLVLLLFGLGYYGYVFTFCLRYLEETRKLHSLSVALLITVHILFALTIISYFQTVFTNPGEIPPSFGESDPTPDRTLTVETKSSGRSRFCQKCQERKPDRAHHCSTCDRCVLKMDHHCPWVDNCVGFYNYKFFNLFLFWTVVLCSFGFLSTIYFDIDFLVEDKSSGSISVQIMVITLSSLVFGIGLSFFGGYHVLLVTRNQSTIEATEKMKRLAGHKNIFNTGSRFKNFQQVFGTNPLLWLLPIRTPVGNGLSYPTNLDSTSRDIEEAPMLLEKSQ